MSPTYTQPTLFPHMTESQRPNKFQIKSFDDPDFRITVNVQDDEDPETLALEYLGYFVVPETSFE